MVFNRIYRGKEEVKKLIFILKTEKISLEEAAREMDVSFQTVWSWVDAKHFPSKLALVPLRKFIKKHGNPDPLTGGKSGIQ